MLQITFGLFLGILTACKVGHAYPQQVYSFSDAEDAEACRTLQFTKITANRRLSSVEMNRKSADQCCKMRGMKLYSATHIDEPDKFAQQMQDKVGENASNWHWASAVDLVEKGKFLWPNGLTPKAVEDQDCRSYKWDNHTWDEGQPQPKGECLAIKVNEDKILMKNAHCINDKLPFICEMETQSGGRGLTGDELYSCTAYKFANIPGYPTMRIFEGVGNWRLASTCCQMFNWSLPDAITSKGKLFHEAISNHSFGADNQHDFHFVWSSGNDFKEFRQWKWSCGEPAEDIEWYTGGTSGGGNSSLSTTTMTPVTTDASAGTTGPPPFMNPDNKLGNENCLAYTDKNTDKGFEAEDYNCNEIGTIICDTNPRCSVQDQYHFGSKEPRTYDVRDTFDDDMELCSSISFQNLEVKMPNSNDPDNSKSLGITIYAGDKNMSWTAAMRCCKDHEMQGVILPKSMDMISILLTVQNLTVEIANKLADGSRSAHRFWFAGSNVNGTPHSNMVWSNEKPVDVSILSKIKITDEVHPICLSIGYDQSNMYGVVPGWSFFNSSCLDKYIPLCMKRNDTLPGSGITLPDPIAIEEKEKISDILRPPTDEEKQYHLITRNRDKCPKSKDFLPKYNETCPNSASNIGFIMQSGPDRNLTNEDTFKMNLQNKRMLTTVLLSGVYGYSVPEHEPRLGFHLMEATVGIYKKFCPIISEDFLDNAFKLFHDLHWSTSQGRSDILKKKDYKWILKLLEKCHANAKTFRARTDYCMEKLLSKGFCENFICTDPAFESRLSTADPVVDVMWKAFELVHSTCFVYFNESYRMHHQYTRAIVDLWSEEIRLRWMNQMSDNEYWVRVLGYDYAMNLLNVERCNQAAISDTFLRIRINRETVPARARLLDEKEFYKAASS